MSKQERHRAGTLIAGQATGGQFKPTHRSGASPSALSPSHPVSRSLAVVRQRYPEAASAVIEVTGWGDEGEEDIVHLVEIRDANGEVIAEIQELQNTSRMHAREEWVRDLERELADKVDLITEGDDAEAEDHFDDGEQYLHSL